MNQENSILYQLKRNHFWSGLFLAKNTINHKFDENLKNAVDYDWYFNLFFNDKKICFIRDSLLNYNIHENNISKNLLSSLNNVQTIFSKYEFSKLKKPIFSKLHFYSDLPTQKLNSTIVQLSAFRRSINLIPNP